MTEKQKIFVREFCKSGDHIEAARIAGYSEISLRQAAHENLKKPHVLAEIKARMDDAGITEEFLFEKLHQGLNATVIRVFCHEGNILSSEPFIDYATRHKYLDTALQLRDMYPTKKIEGDLNINFDGKTKEDLAFFSEHGHWPGEQP